MNGVSKIIVEYIENNLDVWQNQDGKMSLGDRWRHLNDMPLQIYFDKFPYSEGGCIFCRHEASESKVREYLDGSADGVENLSFYARCYDGDLARDILDEILKTVNDVRITSGDFSIYVSNVADPQFVEVTDKNETIYMASIKAEFLKERAQENIFE